MKRVLVSGYFDPIHSGHLDYFREAKKLGDYLIVVVDGDKRTTAKKGKPFMPAEVRADIISEFECVDEVYIEDDDVKKAIQKFRPDIFAKGGDRNSPETIPEWDYCKEIGVEIKTGVGKTVSEKSSDYLSEWVDFRIKFIRKGSYKRGVLDMGYMLKDWIRINNKIPYFEDIDELGNKLLCK